MKTRTTVVTTNLKGGMQMARPIKQGLQYFSFDTDFFSDRKVRKIMNACGPNSTSILICLLCNIYRDKGYYIGWDRELPFDIADIVGVSEGSVDEVIKKGLQVDFFNQELFEKYSILTSNGIQKRFKRSTLKRKDIEINDDYWVNEELLTEETELLTEETELLTAVSTQKESKVKKRKEYPVTPLPVDVPVAVAPAACDKPLAKQKEKTWRNDYGTYLSLVRSAYRALLADTALLDRQQTYYPCVDLPKSLEKACVNFWATPAGWTHKKKTRSADIDLKMTLINAISKNKVYQNEANTETKRYDNGEFLR